ncbi:response regulator transcription factor [Alicyclobacillus fastidiosus]|uniref:LuxR C-terminal-related transcriptional regulator n=1 Tax=Alicyclobacillus fastidiosus TaxID=392011 RepID=A0ABV5AI03_9BACL|nr:LuxR family transcriptional regulator [Alicyclobacillus fastidiosus]WEH10093.1 LuxR C-terminal-related transcriptional regulator [Alicyclobacillus fastidiosus]
MTDTMESVEYILNMFCYRWTQSGYLVDRHGEVLLKVRGNMIGDKMFDKLGDKYRDRVLALIEHFGDLQQPKIVDSKVTYFPCFIFCPLCDNNFYLLTGYFINDLAIQFVNNGDLVESLPQYCLDEQQKMLNDATQTKALIDRLLSSNMIDYSVHDKMLTERERQIVHLVRAGRTNAEIARDLYISENTVKSHISRLFKKLGITRRRDLR